MPEQPGQRLLDFSEGHEAILPPCRTPYCQQQQQWFVWRTLVTSLPDVEFGELPL